MSIEKDKKSLAKKEICPVCKKEIARVTIADDLTKFWNKKCYVLKKICNGHFYYIYEEKIHEEH